MNSRTRRWLLLGICSLPGLFAWTASGQAFLLADIKTVEERNSGASDSPLAPRFYVHVQGADERAPLGTALWFVADLNRDGLAFEKLGRDTLQPHELLGSDDIVLLRDAIDGDQPGNQAGVYRRVGVSLTLPPEHQVDQVLGGNIYAVLWDNATGEAVSGASFGVLNLGINPKPSLGNPFWGIDQDVVANEFAIVPEPGITVVVTAALLVGWSWRRNFRAGRQG